MPATPRTFSVAFTLALPALALGMDFDESVMGDLSGDETMPTSLGALAEGTTTVSGSTIALPVDAEFFSFEILPGTELGSIVLADYTGPLGGGSFIALTAGVGFTSLFDPNDYLGTALVGTQTGALVGDDILDDLNDRAFGGQGFSQPLGPGEYTIWYQETAGATDYSFALNVIPAPGAAVLLGGAGVFAMRRRRA
ncbi:MAG: hypothetical protein AAGH64_09070 [Planctomycetota bacterium]